MRFVRPADFDEFVRWYLSRERRKSRQDADLAVRSRGSLAAEMRRLHSEKLRPWFGRARWSVVLLDDFSDAMTLVCVDSWETRRNGLVTGADPNSRLARTVVAAARAVDYFDNPAVLTSNAVEAHYRRERIAAFRQNWPNLRDDERLAICSLNEEERNLNPGGTYYLHDGFGRLLPYLYLVAHENRAYCPIEAFLAEEPGGYR